MLNPDFGRDMARMRVQGTLWYMLFSVSKSEIYIPTPFKGMPYIQMAREYII